MKKTRYRSLRLCSRAVRLLPLTLPLLIVACDRNDNDPSDLLLDDTLETSFVAPPVNDIQGVNVFVIDETGELISGATVIVINDDQNGNLVEDDLETSLTTDGSTRVSITPLSEPGFIRLEAEKADYFSNGGRYALVPGEDLDVEIILTALSTEAPGISVTGANGNLSEGSVSATATAVDNPDRPLTSVTIPQDLEVLDVDGNVLDEQLRLAVVHFDSTDEQALDAFPGGFDVSVENIMDVDVPAIEGDLPRDAVDTDELGNDVIFESAGFTAIEIFDSQGRKADKFTGEIDITMAIPEGAENPNTGNNIVAGDIIPVWSFDTDTAAWVYEGREAVEPDGRGGLQVTYKADHLSYWNLDFYSRSLCTANANITVLGSDGQQVNNALVSLRISGPGLNTGYTRFRTVQSGNITLFRTPASRSVTVNFGATSPGQTLSNIQLNNQPYNGGALNLCGGTNNFSVTSNQTAAEIEASSVIRYNVRAVAQCINNPATPVQPINNLLVRYTSQNSGRKIYLGGRTDSTGFHRFPDRPGFSTGLVYARYGSLYQSQQVSGGSGNVTLTFPVQCTVTTGGVSIQ